MTYYPRIRDFLWLFLLPASFLWAFTTKLRRTLFQRRGYRSRLRTVCIGNLHAGGTGKTPLVAYLAKELGSWGPVIVSRGYGGTLSKVGAWVDPQRPEKWREVGDEPMYLARTTGRPVRIGANRATSARAVEEKYPSSLLLLDDGFQNFQLRHDVDIVVLPQFGEWWELYTHPLGPLRETAAALRHATAAVIVRSEGQEKFSWKNFLSEHFPSLPLFEVKPLWGGLFLDGKPYGLTGEERFGVFCGIGRPERFFSVLQTHFPSQIRQFRPFPDHHAFRAVDLERLSKDAVADEITHWVTTEKDLVRLSASIWESAVGRPLLTARVEYDISEGLVELIQGKLESV